MDNLAVYIGYESGLEGAARDAALWDDGLQRADSDSDVIRNRDRYGSTIGTPLQDDVTASLPNGLEAVLHQGCGTRPGRKGCGAYPCVASKRVTKTCV